MPSSSTRVGRARVDLEQTISRGRLVLLARHGRGRVVRRSASQQIFTRHRSLHEMRVPAMVFGCFDGSGARYEINIERECSFGRVHSVHSRHVL